jgi:NitT/TauT family transport system permease protein
MVELWNGVSEGWLWPHVAATLYVWVIGYLLASVAGITWGLLIGLSRRVSYVFEPWLIATFVMPSIALVPIFILLFGIGASFKIFFVFLSGFFYVVINTLAGVRASEARYMAVAHSFGAGRMQTIRTVIVPGSIPYIATGLRVAVGRSLVGAVAAEFVASNTGIGFMTTLAGQTFSTDRVIMGVLLLAAAGIGFTALVGRIEKHFDAWRA